MLFVALSGQLVALGGQLDKVVMDIDHIYTLLD